MTGEHSPQTFIAGVRDRLAYHRKVMEDAHQALYGGSVSGPNPPTPVIGPNQPPPQWTKGYWVFQGLLAAPATDAIVLADGYSGPHKVLIINTGTGTLSITPFGSDDGLSWFPARYQQVASQSPPNATGGAAINAPAAASGAFAVAANTGYSLEMLGYFEYYKFPLSAITPTIGASLFTTLCPI